MRISGTVKFFNSAKGFGFITPDEGGKDVFVHATAVERAGMRALNEGDRVSFELEDDRRGRGKQAAQLKPAGSISHWLNACRYLAEPGHGLRGEARSLARCTMMRRLIVGSFSRPPGGVYRERIAAAERGSDAYNRADAELNRAPSLRQR